MRMLGHTKKRTITAATAVIALGLLSFGVVNAEAAPASTTVYDATPSPLPPNIASVGFQATSTSEFGDYVHLAGTDRALNTVTVMMSDWAPYADYASDVRYSANNATWSHPITVNVYSNHLDANGAPDMLLATGTQSVTIPWRPVADPTCTNSQGPAPWAWRAGDGACYSGIAFNAVFDLSGLSVPLPEDVIVGIAFNTQSYGAVPRVVPGPYNSLNVGVPTVGAATVGNDDNAANVFANSSWPGFYADGGTAGVGIFRQDTGWAPNGTVAIKITASAPAGECSFSEVGNTLTLLSDCTTDETILVPTGKTLDGNHHSITAADPTGGHFLGAVVQNAGASAIVMNLTVKASDLTDACDESKDALAGIRLDGATGSISGNTITGLNQADKASGCQEGNAIEVRNTDVTWTPSVNVTGNTVSDYQKTGVLVKGQVSAVVTGNTIAGYGPSVLIAQNGIQVSAGATAEVTGNTISKNFYTPKTWDACGLIIYQAGGVKVGKNTFSANEKNLCNTARGGTFTGV